MHLGDGIAVGNGTITLPMFTDGLRGVVHGFGTKADPELSVGIETGLEVVRINQVHGTRILLIEEDIKRGRRPQDAGHDAVITNQRKVLVTIRTADCVPILFLDPVRNVVAAAHAGWRGTVGGIAAKVVHTMRERFHCEVSSIRAAIGPSIGRCCYEVDDPVLTLLKQAMPYWSEMIHPQNTGRALLDLRRLNQRQLEEAGLQASRIESVNLCTFCHPALFHSYRREGRSTGHMTSGIALI
jgi:hypothetical protein